jgi:hypothetical protein
MPRYLSLHTLACLTRQGAEELTAKLHRAASVKTLRVLVSLYDGKMLVEYEAPNREAVEQWLAAEGFHCDLVIRAELESTGGALQSV